ncbi:ABC transporter ATP-binding protein [Geodermatophilus sabuli]|uniref:Amino acid/amide ABC transporter ATP-binding protein 2, HAAT family n=1 Tax=Geodermatophilus sabuli TaxID=1564158 RepID=A0A285EFJ7_9ACTN|nr:ABC transporter ATP-binding protein [Geodermatophilus sabuli]MBB3086578.1 branched-chain amino acid transport system ATP-binding protein [Geodermatophilus sabuli]SNX97770.1 amino acid/amide ABC transporter ATP-binding protein 2, HAAT family [Geodermatophilus sabuli]
MTEPLLQLSGVHASYGQVEVLRGVDLSVGEGEVVVLLGANGAGKTTTLRSICGMVGTRGSVRLGGTELTGKPTEWIVRQGISHVPQGRGVFGVLSVEENLRVGAWNRKDTKGIDADIDRWYDVFPRLAERRTQLAGGMSGGEQQMLAIARGLMARPRLLLLDEPSLGLAQIITRGLFAQLEAINREQSTSMLIVEQNAELALSFAARGYVLESGSIVLSGSADEVRGNEDMRRAYLGY